MMSTYSLPMLAIGPGVYPDLQNLYFGTLFCILNTPPPPYAHTEGFY